MRTLPRRCMPAALAALALPMSATLRGARAAPIDEAAEWAAFRQRFMQPNGRVIDTGNGGQSHSEGQGWALLFAARCGDRASFELLWRWTESVLRRPEDALHAWRCAPGPAQRVDDLNNATDGDLCIAWALLEAGSAWGDAGFTEAGTRLAADILRLLVREAGGRQVLVPGLRGFEHPDYVVVNPSYYVFPAFPVLAAAWPDPAWVEIVASGLDMLRQARFGRWGLVPDWLALPAGAGPPEPAPGWPRRFSWDAVRVPLYLAWAGLRAEPGLANAAQLWADPRLRPMPAWFDLASNAGADYAAPSGIVAVAELAMASVLGIARYAALPGVAQAPDYYSAALTLLARLAWRDAGLPVT